MTSYYLRNILSTPSTPIRPMMSQISGRNRTTTRDGRQVIWERVSPYFTGSAQWSRRRPSDRRICTGSANTIISIKYTCRPKEPWFMTTQWHPTRVEARSQWWPAGLIPPWDSNIIFLCPVIHSTLVFRPISPSPSKTTMFSDIQLGSVICADQGQYWTTPGNLLSLSSEWSQVWTVKI